MKGGGENNARTVRAEPSLPFETVVHVQPSLPGFALHHPSALDERSTPAYFLPPLWLMIGGRNWMRAMPQELVARASSLLHLWDEAPEQNQPASAVGLTIPRSVKDLAASYDLTISRPTPDMVAFGAFDRWLAAAAASRGLSCCLVHDGVVREAIERLQTGRLHCGFHLDYFALWHVPGDPYARLAEAIRDSGGSTINSPARSRFFTNKANAHAKLRRQGLGVPATLIVAPGAEIDASALAVQGVSLDGNKAIYVKPANGFASSGVTRIDNCKAERLEAVLAETRQQHSGDAFLIQRAVTCPRLHSEDGLERWAYWRIVYCMGELVPFWWHKSEADQGRPSYQRVSGADIKRLKLADVLAYCRDLAKLCGLDWFSTELCASEGGEPSSYHVPGPEGRILPVVAIDYVNDQCDVDVQSRWIGGPPDAFVRHVATRFAEAARARKNCLRFPALSATTLRPPKAHPIHYSLRRSA